MKKISLLAFNLLAIVAMSLSSCKKDDDTTVHFEGKWLVYSTENPAAFGYYTFTRDGKVEFENKNRKTYGTYSAQNGQLIVGLPEIDLRDGKKVSIVQFGKYSAIEGDVNLVSWDVNYYLNGEEVFTKTSNFTMEKDGVGKDDEAFNRLLGSWNATFEDAEVDAAAITFYPLGHCILSDDESTLIFSTFNIKEGNLTINVSDTRFDGKKSEFYGTMEGPTTWESDDLFSYDCKASFTNTKTGETFDSAGLVIFTRK